jgi:hypothetical protein
MRSKYHFLEILTTFCVGHAGDFEHNRNRILDFNGCATQSFLKLKETTPPPLNAGLTPPNFPRTLARPLKTNDQKTHLTKIISRSFGCCP